MTVVNRQNWRVALTWLSMAMLMLFILYASTYASMMDVWLSSETFTHGFFILPISLWLIWRRRKALAAETPAPTYLFTPLLIVLGFGWLIAAYVGVQVVQQLAAVAMIPVVVVSLLGWQVSRLMLFPLAFLFFAVPIGEELIPYLVEFTANFSVAGVRLIGIPVYQEGNFLELPSGNWSVVKACSGVRYLIASAVLGVLFAYLNYSKLWKQALFFLVSLVVPIIANGLRAVMIILIGHYSDMELATGVDHLIFGWFFFGIVVAIMFYIGSFFTDPLEDETSSPATSLKKEKPEIQLASKPYVLPGLLIVLFVTFWPGKYFLDQQADQQVLTDTVLIPPELPGWHISDELSHWRPDYQNLDTEQVTTYDRDGQRVMLYLGAYHAQRQGAELINYSNVLVNESNKSARLIKMKGIDVNLNGPLMTVPRNKLDTESRSYEVLSLFYVHDQFLTGDIAVKLSQVKAHLTGAPRFGVLVAVISEFEEGRQAAGKAFLDQNAPHIKAYVESLYD